MNMLAACAERVFSQLWGKYTNLVVDARTIEHSLRDKNDVWSEDHVAFRTLPGEHTGMHILSAVFEALGYVKRDSYYFEDKQLNAVWFEPPATEGKRCVQVAPKIFVSELILDKFSENFRAVVSHAVNQVRVTPVAKIQSLSKRAESGDEVAAAQLVQECVSFLSSGAAWARPTSAEYELLRQSSEYAAWTLVFGHDINHFTVSVQLMRAFQDIHALNDHIRNVLKIPMNTTGGLTKGSPDLRLEQSSTLAVQLPIQLQDGVKVMPYAFVEFAYRYPLAGKSHDEMWHSYYQGFVANNADKIFESTNLR